MGGSPGQRPRRSSQQQQGSSVRAHIQRMQIRDAIWVPDGRDHPGKQLSRLVLQLQQFVGPYLAEYLSQRRPLGPEQEELLPESFRLVALIRVILWSRGRELAVAVLQAPCGCQVYRRVKGHTCSGRLQHVSDSDSVTEAPRWPRVPEMGWGAKRQVQTLNSASYRWTILGWNTSGRGWWVRGDGSMREARLFSRPGRDACGCRTRRRAKDIPAVSIAGHVHRARPGPGALTSQRVSVSLSSQG